MVKNWTPSIVFVLLLIIAFLWSIQHFVPARCCIVNNKSDTNDSAIQKTNKQSFWSSSSSHFLIHDLRRVCLRFVGFNIVSQILDNSRDEEFILYSLLLDHFNSINQCNALKIMNLSLLYRYRCYTDESFNKTLYETACLGQRNLLLLIKNNCGHVIGAYTSRKVERFELSWIRSTNFKKFQDPNAFLMRIRSKDKSSSPQIFKVKENKHAKYTVEFCSNGSSVCSFGCNDIVLLENNDIKGLNGMITTGVDVFDIHDAFSFGGSEDGRFFRVELLEVFRVLLY
eukprot:404193_1